VRKSDPGRPEVCNLFRFHELVSSAAEQERIAGECRGALIGCVQDKRLLADRLIAYLEPIRRRREELLRDPDTLMDILMAGSRKASERAGETMERVRAAMRLDYRVFASTVS
jgi:tryptophanyl-tRNA synthetase